MQYDRAGNVTGDGSQLTYDATGQQTRARYTRTGGWDIQQACDGDRQRVKKVEGGQTVFYLRSTVLGRQVVAEYNQTGNFTRGYVYDGNAQLLAVQQNNAVWWVHTDPVTKSKRVTDRQGAFVTSIDVDPWGGETSRMENGGALSQKFTTYERDGNGRDQAMMRSYHAWFSRFDQPDPFDGSYDLTNPQSFNRYAYVGGDPVNFIDPSGLDEKPFVDGGTVTVTGTYYDYALQERALSGGRLAGGIRPRRLLPLDPRSRGGREDMEQGNTELTKYQREQKLKECLGQVEDIFRREYNSGPYIDGRRDVLPNLEDLGLAGGAGALNGARVGISTYRAGATIAVAGISGAATAGESVVWSLVAITAYKVYKNRVAQRVLERMRVQSAAQDKWSKGRLECFRLYG